MPKVRRVPSPSIDNCTRSYPYASPSKIVEPHKPMNLSGSAEDVKEWEEARCPICMEPPHNAVLLKCSSHEMGCCPYMCNTSYRHSNCLDQFCKSFASHFSSAILQEIPLTSTASRRSGEVQSEPGHPSQCGSQLTPKLICPLCRGEIYGYMVLEPARRFMNSKRRTCSSETCEFQGTYSELRKHARSEHPSVRPTEVDPSRLHDWIRMERGWDFADIFSSIQVTSSPGNSIYAISTLDLTDLMSLVFYEMFSSMEETTLITSLLANSSNSMPLHERRSGTVHRVLDDTQTDQSARWRNNSSTMHQLDRTGMGRGRTNLSAPGEAARNRRARWRTNLSPSIMPRDLHRYYRESSPGVRISSTRMPQPRALQQVTQTNPWGNMSPSGRIPSHGLRWRDQRWSPYNNQPSVPIDFFLLLNNIVCHKYLLKITLGIYYGDA